MHAVINKERKLSYPDAVLTRVDITISDHLLKLIKSCETVTKFRNVKTDHLPIATVLNLPLTKQQPKLFHNF